MQGNREIDASLIRLAVEITEAIGSDKNTQSALFDALEQITDIAKKIANMKRTSSFIQMLYTDTVFRVGKQPRKIYKNDLDDLSATLVLYEYWLETDGAHDTPDAIRLKMKELIEQVKAYNSQKMTTEKRTGHDTKTA